MFSLQNLQKRLYNLLHLWWRFFSASFWSLCQPEREKVKKCNFISFHSKIGTKKSSSVATSSLNCFFLLFSSCDWIKNKTKTAGTKLPPAHFYQKDLKQKTKTKKEIKTKTKNKKQIKGITICSTAREGTEIYISKTAKRETCQWVKFTAALCSCKNSDGLSKKMCIIWSSWKSKNNNFARIWKAKQTKQNKRPEI